MELGSQAVADPERVGPSSGGVMAFLAGPILPGVERVVRFDYAGVHRARTPSRSGRPVLDTSAGVCAGPAVGCTDVPKRWGGQRDRRAVDRPGSFRGVP